MSDTRARDIANLGSQAGSGLDASDITEGTLGSTVQDNITRLGTVAAGNLSNTAIVWPAGHIIQTQVYQNTGQGSWTGTSFTTAEIVTMGTITPLFETSDILLIGSIAANASGNAANTFIDFYKYASDVTATANLSGKSAGVSVMDDASIWVQLTCIFNDTCSENSLSEKTYGFSHRCGAGSGTSQIGWGAAGENSLIIMEIAT